MPVSDRVLITGGAGFIGSNLAWHFGAAGFQVTVSDSFGTAGKWKNLVSSRLAAIVAPDQLAALLEHTRFDIVIHMGGISSTTEADVDRIVRNNVDLSMRLWDYCAARESRFIYASSAAAYGSGSLGFDDAASTEALARLRPMNAYGWSKLLVDRLIVGRVEAGERAPAQWAGLRFFNVFGPNEYHKDAKRSVVHKVHDQIRMGEPARLFKSYREGVRHGGQLRDFIHVDDCVSVIDWLVRSPAVSGLFNLGTGEARSWHDLATAVFAAAGLEPRIEYIDMPAELREQYQYLTRADMRRLREAGYAAPFLTLEEGVRDYVTRYLATDQPYR